MKVIQLSCLDRLRIALNYSISKKHKEDLKAKIIHLENAENKGNTNLVYSITEHGQINLLSSL